MTPQKKWYKRWYFLIPLSIVILVTLSFLGLIVYFILYPDCSSPLKYKLGSIDPQFELSKEKVLYELLEAENVWESFKQSNLFEYDENAIDPDIVIDFVFDQRQKKLIATQAIDIEIDTYYKELSVYEDAATKYETRLSKYEKEARQLEADVEERNKAMEVWNAGRKTDEQEWKKFDDEYRRLTATLEYLNKESISIETDFKNLDRARINLNQKKKSLSESSKEQISSDLPPENGIWDPEAKKISIYRFLNDRELKWLLAHEFGHALGLEHVEYPRSVMYYATSYAPILSLSNDDVRELSRICMD